jgi:hypothetical protein
MNLPDELAVPFELLRRELLASGAQLSWRDKIKICMPQAIVRPPSTKEQIAAAEAQLGAVFPADLVEILLEMDGIDGLYSYPVCSVERIVHMNREYRSADYLTDCAPFDNLLFFGDTGNGDDFAFSISQTRAPRAVLMRDHEEDSRDEYASGLTEFLIRYSIEYYAL